MAEIPKECALQSVAFCRPFAVALKEGCAEKISYQLKLLIRSSDQKNLNPGILLCKEANPYYCLRAGVSILAACDYVESAGLLDEEMSDLRGSFWRGEVR